jgi:hypothetical protein
MVGGGRLFGLSIRRSHTTLGHTGKASLKERVALTVHVVGSLPSSQRSVPWREDGRRCGRRPIDREWTHLECQGLTQSYTLPPRMATQPCQMRHKYPPGAPGDGENGCYG